MDFLVQLKIRGRCPQQSRVAWSCPGPTRLTVTDVTKLRAQASGEKSMGAYNCSWRPSIHPSIPTIAIHPSTSLTLTHACLIHPFRGRRPRPSVLASHPPNQPGERARQTDRQTQEASDRQTRPYLPTLSVPTRRQPPDLTEHLTATIMPTSLYPGPAPTHTTHILAPRDTPVCIATSISLRHPRSAVRVPPRSPPRAPAMLRSDLPSFLAACSYI
jgi:hypothetical protein